MEPSHREQAQRWRRAALTLIGASMLLRLAYLGWACPLDLAPDEAHYWDWSRHLDWSYYSKGPLVAWLIRLSCAAFGAWSQALTGTEALAVRLPAVMCGGLLLWGLYVLTVQVYQSAKLACAVVAAALTVPIMSAGASLMTIDAPFCCCWMGALVLGYQAVFRPARWAWPAAGACLLLGLLAKHTMILWLPSFALWLATTPPLRDRLRQGGFWLMTGIGALGGVPILVWNFQHDWVLFRHELGHAGLDTAQWVSWSGPARYVGMQFGVLVGFWFLTWVRAVWTHRPSREARPELRFLWWMSVPTLVFFGLFSWKNGGGEANWPLAGYLSGMVLGAGWLARAWQEGRSWERSLLQAGTLGSAALGLLLLTLVHAPLTVQPVLLHLAGPASPQRPAPLRRIDPTTRLRGWRSLAAEVDRVRAELEGRGLEPVLACERWTQTAELGFYCQGHPTVYCLGLLLGDRPSQYDLWQPNPVAQPADFAGRTFLLVGSDTAPLSPFFAAFEPVRRIEYRENGQLIEAWTITIAHDLRSFGVCRPRQY